MPCNNCGQDDKCYDDIVYAHCVKSLNALPYLGLDNPHSTVEFETAVNDKLVALTNYTVNASAIQITVNAPCVDTSLNCLDNLDFTYTLTETATGVLFEQNYSEMLSTLPTYVGQIKVLNNTGLLEIINVSAPYTPYSYAFNNLQLPATIVNDLYITVSGQLIYVTNTIHVDNCIGGTFNVAFSCAPSNTMFSGSLLTLISLMNKQICAGATQLQHLQSQIEQLQAQIE